VVTTILVGSFRRMSGGSTLVVRREFQTSLLGCLETHAMATQGWLSNWTTLSATFCSGHRTAFLGVPRRLNATRGRLKIPRLSSAALFLVYTALITGCASSGAAKYAAVTPANIAAEVKTSSQQESPNLIIFTGPKIDSRGGFGAFASDLMLSGGATMSTSAFLQGTRAQDLSVAHQIVVTVLYGNLLGVYRDYDRAAIVGIDDALQVNPLRRHKQYTTSGVTMTETVEITISEAVLRGQTATTMVAKLSNVDGNVEQFEIPGSYISGYLLAVEQGSKP